jgi:tRNA(Ile)-lysidine synthase
MPEPVKNTVVQGQVQAALEASFRAYIPPDAPVCVAFSGGLDSAVLLHALSRSSGGRPIRAAHVDHGLHAESGKWAKTCERAGRDLQVPVTVVAASVDLASGLGLEAAAREARYAALARQLEPGEVLLTAHHQRDQFETLLLRLLRGAGVHGLAAMSVYTRRGSMRLLRPLLEVPADVIRAYAHAERLEWIEDPSNTDLSIDRNYLRHNVLPALLGRWATAENTVARAARLCGDAAQILDDVAEVDLNAVLDGERLRLPELRQLSGARQRNAVRYVLRLRDLAIPSEQQLEQALATLLEAAEDAQPEAAWPGVRIRRYRQHLWLYAETADPRRANEPAESYRWHPGEVLEMGSVRGTLSCEPVTGAGIAAEYGAETLEVRFRQGGERLRIARNGRTRELKNLLQEMGIVPWMRGHIPLLYSGERLLAVGDLWINADFSAAEGEAAVRVHWENHSPVR